MRRKFLTIMVILCVFALGACTEDATMDELINDIELNQTGDPDDDDEPAGTGKPSGPG